MRRSTTNRTKKLPIFGVQFEIFVWKMKSAAGGTCNLIYIACERIRWNRPTFEWISWLYAHRSINFCVHFLWNFHEKVCVTLCTWWSTSPAGVQSKHGRLRLDIFRIKSTADRCDIKRVLSGVLQVWPFLLDWHKAVDWLLENSIRL